MTARPRARDLGIVVGTMTPGPANAITDVAGVRVGHETIVRDEPDGRAVRTGVTVIVPRDEPWRRPLFAAPFRLNGNGEMTGLEWIRESGALTSLIAITNTHSVGVVRDALVADEAGRRAPGEQFFALPVVAETWDGALNDINGFHVRPEHVHAAIAAASDGPVAEGAVGGGTGMICHGFKGGIGTSSRRVPEVAGGYTVGVLVQANHGERERLTVNGAPVGRMLAERAPAAEMPEGVRDSDGSIIVVVATDAPLLPTQCARLARRAALGIGRTGGAGENGSGDLVLCFSTANDLPGGFERGGPLTSRVEVLSNEYIDPLFHATIEATEEAILGALLAAETMTGAGGRTVLALPHDALLECLRDAGRAG